jgi:hypothetical protein
MRSSCAGRLVASVVLLLVALGLAACDSSGSGAGSASVSGSVSGLASDKSVVLELNGGSALTVSSSGVFTFPNAVSANSSYSVTVASQPPGQVCTVTNGGGAGVTSNVTNVEVSCAAQTFTVGGTLTGLAAGSRVVLENHGADALTLTADGSFGFTTKVAFDGTYAVTVATEPSGSTCSVLHGTGAGVTGDVTSISVTCSPITFTLSGTLSGLTSGMQVTLENNSADPLTLSANGPFTFPIPVAEFGAYNVTVSSEPAGQTCTVTNFQGTQVTRNVSNITVSCSTNTYTVGGSVSGLGTGQQVTLDDNGGDALTLTGNGPFVFTTPLTYGSAYTVTVGTQPTGAIICLVGNGTSSSIAADVTNIGINCVANTVSFTTPGSYTWTVPAGLTSISVVATGGGGGGGGLSGTIAGYAGGSGAIVTGTLSVTPGQVLNLVVGGGGQSGSNGPPDCCGYLFGAAGGGGGSSNVDASTDPQILAVYPEIIAGGGGGGGVDGGSGNTGGFGGDAGGAGGAGDAGANGNLIGASGPGGGGASGGIGGAAGSSPGLSGGNGNGGAGGQGGGNGNTVAGGSGGSGAGAGSGADNTLTAGGNMNGGGGGGYGGGGSGAPFSGGGAGGSTGPAGTTYAPAGNAGGPSTNGGDGSVVLTLQ